MTAYAEFIERKTQLDGMHGFEPEWMPDFLFPFQVELTEWALRKGRAAIFADCGLGKTPMQLVWAENVQRHTGKPVLVMTPLAVSFQTEEEAAKFGIEAAISRDGSITAPITITNWQHCNRMVFFPSHSYEQYYQAVRRSWRFGQTRPVLVDIVTTEGGTNALKNLQRKATAADHMFSTLVAHMRDVLEVERSSRFDEAVEVPSWAA